MKNWRVAERAVVNASPLIFLSRGGHLELLSNFGSSILVPQQVIEEVSAKGSNDVTANAVANAKWIQIVPAISIPESIIAWGLGPSESAVLAAVLQYPECEVIIDDLAARKCAKGLALPIRGTLGIVLAQLGGLTAVGWPCGGNRRVSGWLCGLGGQSGRDGQSSEIIWPRVFMPLFPG